MAILAQNFEVLSTVGTGNAKDFDTLREAGGDASRERLAEITERAEEISRSWVTEIVDNSSRRNFDITEDMTFRYKTRDGKTRERDISSFAFQQLCQRMGIPSQYLVKCAEAGKTDLMLANFKAWSNEYKGTLQIMSNDTATRAVVTDGYERYDYAKVLRAVKNTVDLDRWMLVQSHLSEDYMVLRFVDTSSPFYNDPNSQNYTSVYLSTSDVARAGGALKVLLSAYRRVCTNGMIVKGKEGLLFRQIHSGSDARQSKVVAFMDAFRTAGEYGAKFAQGIERCRAERLNPKEMELWIDKAKRDMKLSKEKTEALTTLIQQKYEPSIWGVANGVTELAQNYTLDSRLDMEEWAGGVFASRL